MTPVFATRRRVEEFAALVDGTSTPQSPNPHTADLLEVVGALRDAAPVEARPEFVASLRDRLLVAAETALTPQDLQRLALPVRRSTRERRIAAAVGGFALVGATTSMAMAAQGALPGDLLYPVKRAIENIHTGVSVGEGDKGTQLLASASGRLDEVSALSRDGSRPAMIAETLNAFTEQATEASDLLLSNYTQSGDESSIAQLRDFTSTSIAELTRLEQVVPDDARDELLRAAQVLFQIDAAAQQACPTCGGAGISGIPNVFVPIASGTEQAVSSAGSGQSGKAHKKNNSGVPSVGGVSLPPGSVLSPPPDAGGSTAADGGADQAPGDPIGSLTQGLIGGGTASPTATPSVPGVGDLLQDTGNAVDEVVDPPTAPVTP